MFDGLVAFAMDRWRHDCGARIISLPGSPMSEGRFDLSTFRSERTNEASTLTITPKRSSSRDVGAWGGHPSWIPDFLVINFDPLVPRGSIDLLHPVPEMSLTLYLSTVFPEVEIRTHSLSLEDVTAIRAQSSKRVIGFIGKQLTTDHYASTDTNSHLNSSQQISTRTMGKELQRMGMPRPVHVRKPFIPCPKSIAVYDASGVKPELIGERSGDVLRFLMKAGPALMSVMTLCWPERVQGNAFNQTICDLDTLDQRY
ncbi:hypothetical protein TNCV_3582691 [Trichonephila clavipes]|nr:hypothetical protein TNCV_3582691 [Trichonephila clavipes]